MNIKDITHQDLVRDLSSEIFQSGFILPIAKKRREAKVRIPKIKAITLNRSLLLKTSNWNIFSNIMQRIR
jgi:hypothetical protein